MTMHDLENAWYEFVNEYFDKGFDVFGTLTFAPPDNGYHPEGWTAPGIQMGRKQIKKWVEKVTPFCDRVFYVEERGSQNDRLHYHFLVSFNNDSHISIMMRELEVAWPLGFVKLDTPKGVGAMKYCLKYCLKDLQGRSPDFGMMPKRMV